MKQLLLISLCVLIAACTEKKNADSSGTKHAREQNGIGVIDLTRTSYPKKTYKDFDIEYIPMETRDDVLFGGQTNILLAHLSESRIILANKQDEIFVFDGKGRIVSNFNHKGQGPKEYLNIRQLVYDEKNREIFVFDRKNRCRVYSEDGIYQRIFEFPESQQYVYGVSFSFGAFNFDDETILLRNHNINSDSMFVFLSKKDGSVKSAVTLPLSHRISNYKMGLDFPFICRDGDTYYLTEWSSDTIYQLKKDKKPQPFLAWKSLTGKFENTTPADILHIIKATDKYLFFSFINIKEPGEVTGSVLMYEVETQKIFDPEFDFFPVVIARTLMNASYPENQLAAFYDMDFLKGKLEKGELDGKLKEIAEKANEDDNPVLQIIKFRE
jgi:hypothetical protein